MRKELCHLIAINNANILPNFRFSEVCTPLFIRDSNPRLLPKPRAFMNPAPQRGANGPLSPSKNVKNRHNGVMILFPARISCTDAAAPECRIPERRRGRSHQVLPFQAKRKHLSLQYIFGNTLLQVSGVALCKKDQQRSASSGSQQESFLLLRHD